MSGAAAHLIEVILIAYTAVNSSSQARGRRGGDLAAGDGTALEAAAVAGRHAIRAINLLKDSSLKEVLLVLDHDAALGHHDGVRTHVLQVLRTARSNCRQNLRVAVFVIDLQVVT